MKSWQRMMMVCGVAGCLTAVIASADQSNSDRVKAAQDFRAKGEAVVPAPDGTIFCEAEEFNVEPSKKKDQEAGWRAGYWGQNYFAATMANTFLSRKAFLGAPEQCDDSTATINVTVKEAGRYLVLARYEAPYRFESRFSITVEQNGKKLLDRAYGARSNIKIWAFGKKLATEVAWDWGAVENIVWEGHDAAVNLQPGTVKITLHAAKQPEPAARRNVDLIMLTRDEAQVNNRIQKEGYLPLDGWLTQAGDMWMRIQNGGAAKVTITTLSYPTGPMQQHSPYWVHMRNWKPIKVDVNPGETTDWIEVGGTMDTLNDGQWGFQSSGPCQIEFASKNAAGTLEPIRKFACNGKLPLVSYADVRYSRKVQTIDEANQELFSYLKSLKVNGKKNTETVVYAMGALPNTFYDFYGITLADEGTTRGYVDWRSKTPKALEAMCQKMTPERRNNIFVVSLGDEIALPPPTGEAATTGFVDYLKSQGLKAKDVDPDSGNDWAKIVYSLDEGLKKSKPGLYYWSHRYHNHYGVMTQKLYTDVLRRNLPNAHIGANYSCHHGGGEYSYLGEVFKWVDCFRKDGMTLPWAEDYVWQVPVGSPQMNGINLDLFRAGNRGKPDRKIMYYVMPHYPGNTPNMWRRLFYNAVGHGATILNLFEFDPVWVAYSENHVTSFDMYATVLRTMRELGLYEDIIQSGALVPAKTALWFSETGDIWRNNLPSFGAGKRGLYVAILGQQLPLDFVVDQDAAEGTLDQYQVLYLTDNNVARNSSEKIAAWVKKGGKLFATAGAGMFDEFNRPNTVLRELLGVEQTELVKPQDQQVHFIKQDISFVKPLETVTLGQGGTKVPAFGIISKIKASKDAEVRGTFGNGAPAVVTRKAGKGEVVYCAFLPALSYFKPAIPLKPIDRGSTDDAMAHFIPAEFDAAMGDLIGSPAVAVERPVVSDTKLVESNVIQSKGGTVIIVANWSGKPVQGLKLTVNKPVPTKSITLASGKKIVTNKTDKGLELVFDLDVADAVILR